MQTFTRAELHDLVWTEPRIKLAKRLGVSDVWIGKACAKSNIPVPGRGHWARLEAGQKVHRTPLPRRGLGQSDYVTLGPDPNRWGYRVDAEIVIPPEPTFEDTLEVVRARAAKEVGHVPIPRGLSKTSRPIAKILEEEEARRQEELKSPYAWKKQRFTVPSAVRRLKLVNALTLGLQNAGYYSSVNADDLSIWVSIGDSGASLKLNAVGNKRPAHHTNPLGLVDDKQEKLQIEFAKTGLDFELAGPWQDQPNNPLESQLTLIATEILVHGEKGYRAQLMYRRKWALERVQEREAAALAKRQKLEAEERERVAKFEKAQLDHLLGLAKRLEQSEQIRTLVQVMEPREAEESEVRRWREWASSIADKLDPRLAPSTQLFPPPPG